MKKLSFLVVIFLLIFLTWHSARSGYASLLISKVDSADDLPAVTKAVRLSPGDPLAQALLGALLEAGDSNRANSDRATAISRYQTAVRLRPDDYLLRLQLARGQELAGDTAGAINSATVAVTLAPFYAQPHWQLGNILVRAGRRDEGFKELRLASSGDPNLLPAIIDLAWQISAGDVSLVKQAVAPTSPPAYLALGNYLARHGRDEGAVEMFGLAGNGTEARQARKQYVSQLVGVKKFELAHQLWAVDHHDSVKPTGVIINPGFEQESDLNENFGWRATNTDKAVTLSLDSAEPKEGRASLRVDFSGAANASAEVLSQLVLVEAKTQYRLDFAVRTENLVSGGLPNLAVVDAADNKLLGQTGPLPQTANGLRQVFNDANGWQETTLNFTTGPSTTAIRVSLGRQTCPAPQCPIFGKLWLDDFGLGPEVRGQRSEVRSQN